MRNLFDEKDLEEMIGRLKKLQADAKPRWGKLNVSGMLFHCHTVNRAILSGKTVGPPTLKQKLMRIYVLNILRKMPMGRQSNPRFFSSVESLQFENEKDQLMESILAFTKHREPIKGGHPVFGRMKKRDWGRFAWIHLDHHLRQFGV